LNALHYTVRQPETKAEFKDYYHLRWKLLRAAWHQPEGSEVDDIETACFHVIAIDTEDAENAIIGVARLQFNSDDEAQIRYMAVAPEYERQGIGRSMISYLEDHAMRTGHHDMVLDAREPAVGFYKKLGYKVTCKSYLLFDEIQHYKMQKHL
jgi:ribosomal protein S18 acetylase RimI-like enzyme